MKITHTRTGTTYWFQEWGVFEGPPLAFGRDSNQRQWQDWESFIMTNGEGPSRLVVVATAQGSWRQEGWLQEEWPTCLCTLTTYISFMWMQNACCITFRILMPALSCRIINMWVLTPIFVIVVCYFCCCCYGLSLATAHIWWIKEEERMFGVIHLQTLKMKIWKVDHKPRNKGSFQKLEKPRKYLFP